MACKLATPKGLSYCTNIADTSVNFISLLCMQMYFYGAVAAANFASTYCQYDALRFVGFTTQALAKCAKMVPVLLIGRLFYKKSYKEKEYVGSLSKRF